jgi:hypothetical protein
MTGMIETSAEIGEIAKALPVAQAAFDPVVLDATNPHFESRYATLDAILSATRPALNANGISFLQGVTSEAGAVHILTRLQHTSGEFIQSPHVVPVSKNDAQGIGSAITYAKRQAAQAILGLSARGEDDDGEGSVGRGSGRPPITGEKPSEPERPSLEKRTARLEKTLNEVKTIRDEDRAWALAKDLRAELAAKDPEAASRLDALHEKRHAELIGGAG